MSVPWFAKDTFTSKPRPNVYTCQAGADAEPVVIGARRRPEAVVLSYERYLQLAGGRERVAAALDAQGAEASEALAADEALKIANDELHAMRRQRRG